MRQCVHRLERAQRRASAAGASSQLCTKRAAGGLWHSSGDGPRRRPTGHQGLPHGRPAAWTCTRRGSSAAAPRPGATCSAASGWMQAGCDEAGRLSRAVPVSLTAGANGSSGWSAAQSVAWTCRERLGWPRAAQGHAYGASRRIAWELLQTGSSGVMQNGVMCVVSVTSVPQAAPPAQ